MMKRYEQIISASVEELARFLVRLSENEREFNYCRNLPECMAMADSGGEIPQEKCVGCMMRWLKEEATADRLEKLQAENDRLIRSMLNPSDDKSESGLLEE